MSYIPAAPPNGAIQAANGFTFTDLPISGDGTISPTGVLTLNRTGTLSLYAPLTNAPLTGIPTAPTAALGTDTSQLATCAFVEQEIADVTGGGPWLPLTGGTLSGALAVEGTLQVTAPTTQDAQAVISGLNTQVAVLYLQNSAGVWTVLTGSSGGFAISGDITGGTGAKTILRVDGTTGLLLLYGPPTNPLHAATKGYVDGGFLPLAGGTLTGLLTVNNAPLWVRGSTGTATLVINGDTASIAASLYVQNPVASWLLATGTDGTFVLYGGLIGGTGSKNAFRTDGDTGLLLLYGPPTATLHAATKGYVDGLITGINIANYLPLTGGTITGPATSTPLNINSAATYNSTIYYRAASAPNGWVAGQATSGNFIINSYQFGTVISINPASPVTTLFYGDINLNNNQLTLANIVGRTDASNAALGIVGEFQSNATLYGNRVAHPASSQLAIATITLGAGDWQVGGSAGCLFTSNPSGGGIVLSISLASTYGVDPAYDTYCPVMSDSLIASGAAAEVRFNLTTTTNIALWTYNNSTIAGASYGQIWARRVR